MGTSLIFQDTPDVPNRNPATEQNIQQNSRILTSAERSQVQISIDKLRQQGKAGEAGELQYMLDHNRIRFSSGLPESEWYAATLSDDMISLSTRFFKKGFDSSNSQFWNLWRSGVLLHELVHIHQHHGTDPNNVALRELLALNQQKIYVLNLIQNSQDPVVLALLQKHLNQFNNQIQYWIIILDKD